MLRVRLYVSRDFKEESSKYGITKEYGEHDRLRKLYGEVDLDALFDREVHHRLGKMLISGTYHASITSPRLRLPVAATEAFRDRVWDLVRRNPSRGLTVVDSAFEPKERRGFWFSRRSNVRYQGVV